MTSKGFSECARLLGVKLTPTPIINDLYTHGQPIKPKRLISNGIHFGVYIRLWHKRVRYILHKLALKLLWKLSPKSAPKKTKKTNSYIRHTHKWTKGMIPRVTNNWNRSVTLGFSTNHPVSRGTVCPEHTAAQMCVRQA